MVQQPVEGDSILVVPGITVQLPQPEVEQRLHLGADAGDLVRADQNDAFRHSEVMSWPSQDRPSGQIAQFFGKCCILGRA